MNTQDSSNIKRIMTPRQPESPLLPGARALRVRCAGCACESSHRSWQGLQKNFALPARHASIVRCVCSEIVEQRLHLKVRSLGLRFRPNRNNTRTATRAITPIASRLILFTASVGADLIEAQELADHPQFHGITFDPHYLGGAPILY